MPSLLRLDIDLLWGGGELVFYAKMVDFGEGDFTLTNDGFLPAVVLIWISLDDGPSRRTHRRNPTQLELQGIL